MTEFVLVRHGETDWNAAGRLQGSQDVPLNAQGISQARAAAAMLGAESWDVVISSPLSRAFETAVQIIDPLGFTIGDLIIDPRLKERHYGAAEGLNLSERRANWPDDMWPNAETPEMMDQRTGPTMHDLARQHAGKRVMIVGHGSWIRSALRVLSNHHSDVMDVHIPNAICSWLTHDGEKWHLGDLGVAELAPLFD